MLFQYSWDNIAQVKSLRLEAWDNIAQEKILFNVVLILLAEHCTSNNIEKLFFLCSVVSSLLDNIAEGFYLSNVLPKVLRQH